MKLMIEASVLAAALKSAGRILPRATNPTQNNVQLKVDDNDTLTISTCSGDEAITIPITIDGAHEKGTTIVYWKHLMDIVEMLPNGPVAIDDVTRGNAGVQISWATGNAFIPVYEVTFPPIKKPEDAQTVIVDAGSLRTALGKTVPFVADDNIRPALSSLRLEFSAEGVATSVGTDTRILVASDSIMKLGVSGGVSTLLPKTFAEDLLFLLDKEIGGVKVSIAERKVVIETSRLTFACTPVVVKYPDWKSILPKNNDKTLVVVRKDLVAALRRIGTVYSGIGQGVVSLTLTQGEDLVVVADNFGHGVKAKEKIPVKYDGDTLSISFKVESLIPLLSSFDEESVKITFKGEKNPAVVKGVDSQNDGHLGLIMPCMTAKK